MIIGDLDIVVGEYKARISYLENIGSASAPKYEWRRGDADPFDGMAFGDEMNPALADLDGDGDFDLAVGDEAGLMKYYENVGSAERPLFVGRTGSANPFEGVEVAQYCAPRFVDLDGAGLNLVVGDEKGGLTVYENKASSAVAPVVVEIAGSASPLGFVDVDIHASAAAYSAPTLVDYDGDNDLDVVVGHNMLYNLDGNDQDSIAEYEAGASALTFFFYENVGSSVAPAFVQKTGSDPFAFVDAYGKSAATFGDLDQDGDLDLVVGDEQGSILYYENVGLTAEGYVARQGFASPISPWTKVGGVESFNLALGDLDGDGAVPRCLSRDPDRATNIAPSQATSTWYWGWVDLFILSIQLRFQDIRRRTNSRGAMNWQLHVTISLAPPRSSISTMTAI